MEGIGHIAVFIYFPIPVLNVIERNYRDKDDKWKSTSSFKINDLPKVILVANKAYEFLSIKADNNEVGIEVG